MPVQARITLYLSFLLAVVGLGCGAAGLPPVIMFACVGLAAVGVIPFLYFIYRVPKPVLTTTVRLAQTGDDAMGVVRRALTAIRWVETTNPTVQSAGGSGAPGAVGGDTSIVAGAVMVVAAAAVGEGLQHATAEARRAVAPDAPSAATATLLCHPPKPRLDDVRTIVRISITPDAWGSSVTLGGASYVRSAPYLRKAMAQLSDAITAEGRRG